MNDTNTFFIWTSKGVVNRALITHVEPVELEGDKNILIWTAHGVSLILDGEEARKFLRVLITPGVSVGKPAEWENLFDVRTVTASASIEAVQARYKTP